MTQAIEPSRPREARRTRGKKAAVKANALPSERPAPIVSGATAAPYIMCCLVALYAAVFSYVSVQQHEAFQTHAFDLGNMDQAVWNSMEGRWFRFTNWEGGTSRLAAHVEPVLLLVAQLYRLANTPKTLLVLQSVVIALGALPAYWLARDKLQNHVAAVAFGAAYLLMPAVQSANLFEFHAVSLSAALLLFAFYFAHRKAYTLFFVCALLAMGTKEQVPLSVALMGLYILVVQRNRQIGLITIVAAVTWFFVAVELIIPAYNAQGVSPYVARYDSLGNTPGQIVSGFFTNPTRLLAMALKPDKIEYLRILLGPTAYLAVLSPLTLALAAPDLAINMFSSFPSMYGGSAHYGAVIAPFVVISAIYGAAHLIHLVGLGWRRLAQPAAYVLAAVIVLSSATSSVQEVFRPLADYFPRVTMHHHRAEEIIARIPPTAGVSASSVLNPHVSHRERLYLFPEVKDADHAFLDVTSTPYPTDYADIRWNVQLMLEEGWGVVAANDGYLLLKRDEPNRQIPAEFYRFTRADQSAISRPLQARFGSNLHFLGYDLTPGTVLHGRDPYVQLTLYWKLSRPTVSNYAFTAYLLDATGVPISAQTENPTVVWHPTSRWQADEVVRMSSIELPLYAHRDAELVLAVTPSSDPEDDLRLAPEPVDSSSALQTRAEGTLLFLTQLQARR